jgi:hypothetical protein
MYKHLIYLPNIKSFLSSPYNRPPGAYRGSRGIALLILNLGARWWWVVSTTHRPLYPRKYIFAGHMTSIGEGGFRIGFWWGNRKERDQLEDIGLREEDNIKMDLKEIVCEGLYWFDLTHYKDRLRNLLDTVMNSWPS